MKSTIVLTLKCLALSGLIIASCTIAETIDFNFDYSGTKTVEFQYISISKDGLTYEAEGDLTDGLQYIDSIALWMDNVSNVKIDTTDKEMAKLTYDFTAAGPQIKDKQKYNYFMKKMPEEMQWYFKEQPNTFKVLNENQVLWNAVERNINDIKFESKKKLSNEYEGLTSATTLNFERKIKDIAPKLEDIFISLDRKSITSEINIDDVFEMKRANEVVITFE